MQRMIEEFEINGLVKDVYYGDLNHIILLANPGLVELDYQANSSHAAMIVKTMCQINGQKTITKPERPVKTSAQMKIPSSIARSAKVENVVTEDETNEL